MRRGWLFPLVITLALLIEVPGAKGAHPGRNGRIAFDDATCAYQSERERIATIRPDGTGFRRLGPRKCFANVPPEWEPEWSAEGTRLLVQRRGGLALVAADGSLLSRLPFSRVSDATLSPDGRRLAFTRPDAVHPVIWTARLDGSNPRPLRYGVRPRWSPDGETIAYVDKTTFGPDGPSGGEIWLMRASTGEAIRRIGPSLTSDTLCCAFEHTESLDWSPDGRRLLYSPYTCCYDSNIDLFEVETGDSGITRQLTFTRRQESHAVWSPNGRRIAFTRAAYSYGGEEIRYSIWTMPASGGRPTRVWASRSFPAELGPQERPYLSWQPRKRDH